MTVLVIVLVVGYVPVALVCLRHGRISSERALRDEWKRVQAHTEQVLAREMYRR